MSLRQIRYRKSSLEQNKYSRSVSKTEASVGGSVMWTAAKENSCGNKFEWCSQKLFFHVNPDLAWKKQENISPSDKCVTFEMDGEAKDGRLGRSNCEQQNRIVCEVL
jgi:hypothetical protein